MKTNDSQNLPIREWYINNFRKFEERLNGNGNGFYSMLRKQAIQHFEEIGFPKPRSEDWKYTNIQPILDQNYSLPDSELSGEKPVINDYMFADLETYLLVFLNGRFVPSISKYQPTESGIKISNLKTAFKKHSAILEKYLTQYAEISGDSFTALNTAYSEDGLFVFIPDNSELDKPIHLLNISDPRDTFFQSHPRNLIVLGNNSEGSIIETHYHASDGTYFHNAVSEIIIGADSRLQYTRIQDDSASAYRISRTNFHQSDNSLLEATNIDLGGAIVRNNTDLVLDGKHIESNLFGYYHLKGNQHVDNHTNINHIKPNCDSNELFKGILEDKARGVFSGTIYVARDAQKTNAFQSNKNLLLSNQAEIDTKPQLKIFADDVKCSHGATIGELDEESIFYLQQRGIGKTDAEALLRAAFAGEVTSKIRHESVRIQVENLINKRLQK
jgi:Fe-S cluster assembly protein SufD